jgi:hypothetical protein
VNKKTAAGAVVVAALVAFGANELYGQKVSQISGDFRNATTAEVLDAQGQPLLRGSFAPVDADDKGEVERLATLTAVEAGSGAAGEAEVEYQTDNPGTQEIELTATGVAPGSQVSLVIDGTNVASATADQNGKVELEVEAKTGAAQ